MSPDWCRSVGAGDVLREKQEQRHPLGSSGEESQQVPHGQN